MVCEERPPEMNRAKEVMNCSFAIFSVINHHIM